MQNNRVNEMSGSVIQNVLQHPISIGDECEKFIIKNICRGKIHSVFEKVINIESYLPHPIDNLFSVCLKDVPPGPARIILDNDVSWVSLNQAPGQEFELKCNAAPVWRKAENYTLASPKTILENLEKIHVPENEALKNIAFDDVNSLIGRGPGLTPSGDDFIAGVLFSLHFLRNKQLLEMFSGKVSRVLNKTTRLSQHFLKYALAGKWGKTEQDLMIALMAGTGNLNRAINNLLAVGSSSGADELQGIMAGIRTVLKKKSCQKKHCSIPVNGL